MDSFEKLSIFLIPIELKNKLLVFVVNQYNGKQNTNMGMSVELKQICNEQSIQVRKITNCHKGKKMLLSQWFCSG